MCLRLDSPTLVVFYDHSNHHFDALAILYVDASFSLVAIQSYQLTESILFKLFIIGLFMYMAKCSLKFQSLPLTLCNMYVYVIVCQ